MNAQTGTVVVREALARLLQPRTIAVVGLNDALSSRERIFPALQSDAEIFFVNPEHDVVCGHRTYRSLSSIGRPIDAIMSVMPAGPTTALIEESEQLDVGGLVAVGGGTSRTSTAATALRSRMKAAARRTGIPLIGPESLGFINVPQRINLTAIMPSWGRPGGISIVSQSGELLNQLALDGDRAGYGYNLLISAGDEAVTDLADYVEFLADDPGTHAIALVVRRIRRPEAFLTAARRAAEAGKPVAVLKLATADGSPYLTEHLWMFDIALRQSGITVVTDPGELVESLAEPARTRRRRNPARPISHAGGAPSVVRIASCTRAGTLAPIAFSGWDDQDRPEVLNRLFRRKPPSRRERRILGPCQDSQETSGEQTPPLVTALPRPQAATKPLPGGHLLPFEATMEILRQAGIPVAPYHVMRDSDDPLEVRTVIQGPYTLRLADTYEMCDVVREDVPADEFPSAVAELRAAAAQHDVPPVIVVQPHLEVLKNCFVGILSDCELGPTVIFGAGEDVDGRMAPLSLREARSLVDESDGDTGDYRYGYAQHEREALAGTLAAASRLAVAARGWMRSLDINALVRTRSGVLVADAFCLLQDDGR